MGLRARANKRPRGCWTIAIRTANAISKPSARQKDADRPRGGSPSGYQARAPMSRPSDSPITVAEAAAAVARTRRSGWTRAKPRCASTSSTCAPTSPRASGAPNWRNSRQRPVEKYRDAYAERRRARKHCRARPARKVLTSLQVAAEGSQVFAHVAADVAIGRVSRERRLEPGRDIPDDRTKSSALSPPPAPCHGRRPSCSPPP